MARVMLVIVSPRRRYYALFATFRIRAMNDWSLRMASAMISTSLFLEDSSAMTFADVWRMTGRLCPASFAVSVEQRAAASDIRQALWVGLLLYHLSAGERL